ncbi:MAG: hypothetical protein ACT4QC_05920 [Planctomycetaceae bacterium]
MKQQEWEAPKVVSLPKGTDHLEKGKYGPNFPKTPACYGFTLLAKIKPGREDEIRKYGQVLEKALAKDATLLSSLKLHYLRWVFFPIGADVYFMYQGIFDTPVEKYVEDGYAIFVASGVNTVFEHLEGFPEDWKTNRTAFCKYFFDHLYPSFIEYGEYPGVSGDEIKKALRVKAGLSEMLDQMQ